MTENLTLISLAVLAVWLALPLARSLARRPPDVGDPAPGFTLPDAASQPHSLTDYAGRWVVLAFYPRDDTPGCTREACGLRDANDALTQLDVSVLGVSVDTPARHAAFASRYQLGFSLLADTTGEVAAAYGSLLRIGPLRLAQRRSFLIAPDGRIAARYLKVSPANHAATLLADVQRLQTPG